MAFLPTGGGHGRQPGLPVVLAGMFPRRERAVVCLAVGFVGGRRDEFEVAARISMMPETVRNGCREISGR